MSITRHLLTILLGDGIMIMYTRLWETMKKKKISQYKLLNTYHMSAGQLDRLRKNAHVSTYTLNRLCEILSCDIEDIVEYLPDEEEAGKEE